MGPDAIRATMFGQMRDAMKDDVEKLLQVQGPQPAASGYLGMHSQPGVCFAVLMFSTRITNSLPCHKVEALPAAVAASRPQYFSLQLLLYVLQQLSNQQPSQAATFVLKLAAFG
jgi:hypothetical protein